MNINKEAYDLFQPMKYLQYEFMDFHGEIAKDVFITKYSDGSEVVSNYSKQDYLYKGQPVKPMDYRLYKPEVNKPEVKKTVKTQVAKKSNAKKQQTQTVTEQTAWEKFKAWVKSFKN